MDPTNTNNNKFLKHNKKSVYVYFNSAKIILGYIDVYKYFYFKDIYIIFVNL